MFSAMLRRSSSPSPLPLLLLATPLLFACYRSVLSFQFEDASQQFPENSSGRQTEEDFAAFGSHACCRGRGTGNFLSLTAQPPCSAFCSCSNGLLLSFIHCPPGLLFSEELSVCVPAQQSLCPSLTVGTDSLLLRGASHKAGNPSTSEEEEEEEVEEGRTKEFEWKTFDRRVMLEGESSALPPPPRPPFGRHPPGVGKHPPGVGKHPPDCGKRPPGVGKHGPNVGGYRYWSSCKKRRFRSPPPGPLDVLGCCVNRGTGTFSALNSDPPCRDFCVCVNSTLVESNTCYAGTLFNDDPEVQSCDFAPYVSCDNGTYNVPPPPPLRGLANGGVLTTGYYARNAFDCDNQTDCPYLPFSYTKRNEFMRFTSVTPQAFVDWRNPDIMTPVKLQQACRACWAFSAVAAIETALAINDRDASLRELSVQQVLDCLSPYGDTCDGGDPNDVLDYVARIKTLVPASVYPLRNASNVTAGTCESALVDTYANSTDESTVVAWERVRVNDPQALMAVVSSQPAIIAISTLLVSFFTYSGGIYEPTGECGVTPTHNLVVVGYGVTGPYDNPPNKKYWLARNSWGTEWGEAGYMRIARYDVGAGVCGMLAVAPVYPVVRPLTYTGHQNRRVNARLKLAYDPNYRRTPPPVYLRPPPSPPRHFGGRHPPGVGKRPPGVGSHPPDQGDHPPTVGDHPPEYGKHPPGIGDRIYPPTPCNGGIPDNTCGAGTCVPTSGNTSYICSCPSGYVDVPNTVTGEHVCALVDVCFSTTYNPCGVGKCTNDGLGSYSCSCPSGFSSYARSSDGSLTCGPEDGRSLSIGNNTWNVTENGQTCAEIEEATGLTNEQLLALNPGLECVEGETLKPFEIVAIGPVAITNDCAVIYSTTKTDTCNSIIDMFSVGSTVLTTSGFEALNPTSGIDCGVGTSAVPANIPVCVAPGNVSLVQACGLYYTIPEDKEVSCSLLYENTTTLDFFSLNPGINCDNLLPGQEVCLLPMNTGANPCTPRRCPYYNKAARARLGEKLYTVRRGDTCAALAQRKFHCAVNMIACLNGGVACSNSRLVVGQKLCYPSWPVKSTRCITAII